MDGFINFYVRTNYITDKLRTFLSFVSSEGTPHYIVPRVYGEPKEPTATNDVQCCVIKHGSSTETNGVTEHISLAGSLFQIVVDPCGHSI
jgi:hypothetical protein